MNLKPVGSNQTELAVNQHLVLFSYQTPVAYLLNGNAYVTQTHYSRTTSRHISLFLTRHGFSTQCIIVPQEKIDSLVKAVK